MGGPPKWGIFAPLLPENAAIIFPAPLKYRPHLLNSILLMLPKSLKNNKAAPQLPKNIDTFSPKIVLSALTYFLKLINFKGPSMESNPPMIANRISKVGVPNWHPQSMF